MASLKLDENYFSSPYARIVSKQSTVSLQMLNTGDLEIASSLLTFGNTFLNVEKIIKNIIIAGIITIKQGQFTHAIDIIRPIIIKNVEMPFYAKRRTFVSIASVSFDNLFKILP